MDIRICSKADIKQLAEMNKRLIEDEKSSNPMDTAQLTERTRDFLANEYTAYLFTDGETAVGHAPVRLGSSPSYLRQFYIEREYRRSQRGRNAFELLKENLQTDVIDIDVLTWNAAGRTFWKSIGFEETCISMRYERK